MDIKGMQLFLAIAEEKNLTRAAMQNGYTQSAASHILKNLETDLGFPLFTRTQKGLSLTGGGEKLLPHVRQILFAMKCLEQEADTLRCVPKGNIPV